MMADQTLGERLEIRVPAQELAEWRDLARENLESLSTLVRRAVLKEVDFLKNGPQTGKGRVNARSPRPGRPAESLTATDLVRRRSTLSSEELQARRRRRSTSDH